MKQNNEYSQIIPAIVVVGYNRIKSIKRLLHSLKIANYDSLKIPLVFSLDKSDIQEQLIKIANEFIWSYGKKEIIVYKERQGLRSHILQCGDLSKKYGAVIILEDDIVVAPYFYNYVLNALHFYGGDDKVAGIALYSHKYNGYAKSLFEPICSGYDIFYAQFSVTWGQCWTEKQWNAFKEWYNKNSGDLIECNTIPNQITHWPSSSWGKYFVYYLVQFDKYYVMPYVAYATCFSDCGQHTSKASSRFQVPLQMGNKLFNFATFQQAEKYDIFMEYINGEKLLREELKGRKICCNLYGEKKPPYHSDYLLTLEHLDYKILRSFGLKMVPIELNIKFDIEGNDIFLYDLSRLECNQFDAYRINDYEMRWVDDKKAIKYSFHYILNRFKRIIGKMFGVMK